MEYKTTDLALASYLKLKGFNYTLERTKNIGTFIFNEDVTIEIKNFYQDKDSFRDYANAIKDLKRELKTVNTKV